MSSMGAIGSGSGDAMGATPAWWRIWLTAVTRPSVAGYESLARRNHVGPARVCMWLLGSSLICGFLVSVGPILTSRGGFDRRLIVAIPAFALVAALVLAFFAACIHGVARLLNGKGQYRTLIYLFVAFTAPLMVLAGGLSFLPRTGVFLTALYFFWLALYFVAVRAVHQLSLMKAVGAVMVSLIVLAGGLLGVAVLLIPLRF
jgi:hypothetical protein